MVDRSQRNVQYIPLLENLKALLSNYEILQEVRASHVYTILYMSILWVTKSHVRNDGLLGDYCDASMYKRHPLFSNCDDGALYLQFIMYCDDVELTNPLGSSRGKHKLGITNTT